LPSITQPTLVVHPRHDDRASLRNVVHLQRNLGGRVDVVILEDSYHLVTLDRQRDVVLDRTASFARAVMAGVGASGAQRPAGPQRPAAVA
jgi:carboxylesterase